MSVELWDVFDENGIPTGKTALRGRSVLAPGEYHLVVHIWVISKSGLFLIQRRADDKKLMPGEWAATGGAAVAGEDSLTAARRELLEELGIAADRDKMLLLTRIKRRNSLLDVWLTESNVPAEKLTLQQTEVAEAKWITGKELKEMIKNGTNPSFVKELETGYVVIGDNQHFYGYTLFLYKTKLLETYLFPGLWLYSYLCLLFQ